MEIFGIPLKIQYSDGEVVVSDDAVNMYGAGIDVDAAVADYKQTLTEYYEDLSAGNLGSNLQKHLDYLNEKLK